MYRIQSPLDNRNNVVSCSNLSIKLESYLSFVQWGMDNIPFKLSFKTSSDPLEIWESKRSEDGVIEFGRDDLIQSPVLTISGNHIAENYILCPAWGTKTLGITLKYFNMQVKNVFTSLNKQQEIVESILFL